MRGKKVNKVKTKVEYIKARDKICFSADKSDWRSGFLVTAFTEEKGEPIHLLSAKLFDQKPGKKKIAQVRKEGEVILMKESFAGEMAELLDMIDEEKNRFQ